MVRAHPDVVARRARGLRPAARARRSATSTSSPRAAPIPPRSRRRSPARRACARCARRRHGVGRDHATSTARCSTSTASRATSFAVALWRATGSAEHVDAVAARLAERGFALDGDAAASTTRRRRRAGRRRSDALRARRPGVRPAGDARGTRRDRGRGDAARMPALLEPADIRGVLHCHSDLVRRQGDDRRDGRRGARARLELHRHHRPLAGGVLRRRPLARRACSRSTTRSTR